MSVAAVVLAAGSSSRMGSTNKLLVPVDGTAMVRRTCEAALASRASPVLVVTGADAAAVRSAIDGLDVEPVHNPAFAAGLSTSLRAGVLALPDRATGVAILLGDMPWVRADHIDRLLDAFAPEHGRDVCAPVCEARRGNPVVFGRRYFPELCRLTGDRGARPLLETLGDRVALVAADRGVLADVDTPADLAE